MLRYNYHEFRKYQKRESYHKKVISEQKAEIKKLKLDTQKLETVESEKRKANKSMAYFKKQNSEYREINQNQKQLILQLQRDLADKDRNIDNLIAQVNELIEDKINFFRRRISTVRPSGCSRSTFIWSRGETYRSDNTNCT